MEHIYHRGKYRSYEWCKHLRPFGKRVGNKRWRKDAVNEIEKELDEASALPPYRKKRKKKKLIKVKFTMKSASGFTRSYYRYYETRAQAEDAIKRNEIEGYSIFGQQGEIIKKYEKRNNKQAH